MPTLSPRPNFSPERTTPEVGSPPVEDGAIPRPGTLLDVFRLEAVYNRVDWAPAFLDLVLRIWSASEPHPALVAYSPGLKGPLRADQTDAVRTRSQGRPPELSEVV